MGEQASKTSRDSRSTRLNPGFWSLVITQFQGAFNDNALKFLVIYLVVDMSLPARERDWLVLVVGALFALPFILFSMAGGFLADRFSKRSVTIGTKWMEVGIMLFALAGLAHGNLELEAAAVFLLSAQAAIFGPSKYGLLPELLAEKDLSWGNGVVELGTFLAAISATVASGFLAYYFRGQQERSGGVLLGCTLVGLATSFGISRVPPANPTRKFNPNPFGDLGEQIRLIRSDRVLCWAVVGNFYLWFLAALLQFTIVIYGHDILRIDERHISYLQAAVAIGIGLGSLAAGYLSDAKIEYGLIPVGAVGMTVFGFFSASHGISLEHAAVYLGLLGFFGGFYAVPLNALIQHRPDPARKGGIIAAANLISFVGVFAAAAVYFGLAEGLRLSADQIFLAGACMTLAATLYAVLFLPDSVLRLALWILTHTIYDMLIEGRDNIPERGGAIFVANQLTLREAVFLAAATDRTIRFMAETKAFAGTAPMVRRALRIDLSEGREPHGGMAAVIAALTAGEVLCVPAGERQGPIESLEGRRQLQTYMARTHSPLVGVSICGADSGPLQVAEGRVRLKLWHARGHVKVEFQRPMTPEDGAEFADAMNGRHAAPTLQSSAS